MITGIDCRIGRIQINHIACSIVVWNCLKKVANAVSTIVYQVKNGLLRNYLIQELPKCLFPKILGQII